ncbi:unnamed protein product, partial [Symbiodinium microadriaticum]
MGKPRARPFSLWDSCREGFDLQAVESKLVCQEAEWANKPALWFGGIPVTARTMFASWRLVPHKDWTWDPLEENCVIFSPEGPVSTLLADGDLALQVGMSADMDGDDNCITTQPELVEFLRLTKPWEDKRNWKEMWTLDARLFMAWRASSLAFTRFPLARDTPPHDHDIDSNVSFRDEAAVTASQTALLMEVLAHKAAGLASFVFRSQVARSVDYLAHGKDMRKELGVWFLQDKHVLVAGSACDMGLKLLTVRRKVNDVPYFVIRCLARQKDLITVLRHIIILMPPMPGQSVPRNE